MQNKAEARVCVIIPAYNAERYIEKTVRSVLDQTFRELTLLVVNDGSTDGTAAILEGIAARDDRLRVLNVENGGPARARNIALAEARAEYIMFSDADDILCPDALEYAVRGAAGGAELVIFGYTIVAVDGTETDYFEPEQYLSRGELGAALPRLYKANLLNQVWGKLFRAELLRGGAFRDYRWGEDRLFMFDCLKKTRSAAVLPERKYRYVMHQGESLITKYYDKKFSVCLEADREARALCRELGVAEDDGAFRYMFLKSVFSCVTTLFAPSCPLDRAGKLAYVRDIVGEPAVRARLRGESMGAAADILCSVMRSGSAPLCLLVFRAVALAGRLSPRLFIKLKHRK